MAYSSIDACPADKTKRSRFGHKGFSGSYRRYCCHKQYATGARPMGAPGCPEFACCTASIARVRMVLMQSVSNCCPVAKTCSLATMRLRSFQPALLEPGWSFLIRVPWQRKGSVRRKVYQFPKGDGWS